MFYFFFLRLCFNSKLLVKRRAHKKGKRYTALLTSIDGSRPRNNANDSLYNFNLWLTFVHEFEIDAERNTKKSTY